MCCKVNHWVRLRSCYTSLFHTPGFTQVFHTPETFCHDLWKNWMPGLENHQSMSLPEKNYLSVVSPNPSRGKSYTQYCLNIHYYSKVGVSIYYFIYYFHSVLFHTQMFMICFIFLRFCKSLIVCQWHKSPVPVIKCLVNACKHVSLVFVRWVSGQNLDPFCVRRGDPAEGLRSQEETHKAQQVKTLLSGPAERLTWIQSISVQTHLVFKRTKYGERPMACISRMLAKHD